MSPRARLLGVLWVAGGVSVACNVLAADPGVVARAVGAWFPIALLLVVHVFAEVDLPAGAGRWCARGGAVVVAVSAAVASFNHMHEVAVRSGEPDLVAYLFPLSVDGLAVVAAVALAALDRVEHVDRTPTPDLDGVPASAELVNPQPEKFLEVEPVAAPSPSRPVPVFGALAVSSPVLNGAGSNNQETK